MNTTDHFGGPLAIAVLVVAAALTAPVAAQTASAPTRPEIPLGLDLHLPIPEDNPLSQATVALGRKVFFDSILSRDGTRACATCHDPERAFTDGRPVSVGVFGRRGTRSVPTLINRAYGTFFFWDGRTTSLEEQVLKPIQDPSEMDMPVDDVVRRLQQDEDYRTLFQAAFGRAVNGGDLANALASYVRTILSGNLPIDRYRYAKGELDALSDRELQGLRIFRRKANCSVCHVGPNFTDERFHNTGIAWRGGVLSDSGRYVVTGREEQLGAFKTPTLREVALTAPYMHDGSLATLEDVIEFYDRGGNANPYLDPGLRRLNLTDEEKEALLAFLRALSGEVREGLSSRGR